ncbi:MAG: hypothetical protein WC624_01480 [Candidatus Margulisiibacteriota bacterium]
MHDLNDNIGKFLDVYRVLTPEARAAFEAQIDKSSHGKDEKTKGLYRALLKAAKDNLDTEEAIEMMTVSLKSQKL